MTNNYLDIGALQSSGLDVGAVQSQLVATTATLSGATTGTVGIPVTYTVTLDHPAGVGGVSCPISSSVGGDTIATSPIVITQGSTTGTCTVTGSSAADRLVILGTTTPSLTIAGSPITLTLFTTPAPTTATLSGPTTCTLEVPVTYTITLDEPAQTGGVSCPVTDSHGADTVATSPVVVAEGQSSGTLTVTTVSTGSRTITLGATTPSLTIAGSPITLISSATPLVAGIANLVSLTTTTASVIATAASGGVPTYTYQWQQSTDGVTFSNSSGSGVTTLTATITGLIAGTLYYLQLVVTDSASTTADSNIIQAAPGVDGGQTITAEMLYYLRQRVRQIKDGPTVPGYRARQRGR